MNIAFLTGISTEHQYLGPMRPDGVIMDPPERQYYLVFNYGQFRLPVTPEQAEAVDEFMQSMQEEAEVSEEPQETKVAPHPLWGGEPSSNGTTPTLGDFGEPSGAQLFSAGTDDYSAPPHEVTETDDEEEDGVPQY